MAWLKTCSIFFFIFDLGNSQIISFSLFKRFVILIFINFQQYFKDGLYIFAIFLTISLHIFINCYFYLFIFYSFFIYGIKLLKYSLLSLFFLYIFVCSFNCFYKFLIFFYNLINFALSSFQYSFLFALF